SFAGDIVRTVAATPSLTSVAILAAIVGVRTFLSFSLGVELNGRWPWQKRDIAASQTENGSSLPVAVAVHGEVRVDRLRHMIYAYSTFHRAIEDTLRSLA